MLVLDFEWLLKLVFPRKIDFWLQLVSQYVLNFILPLNISFSRRLSFRSLPFPDWMLNFDVWLQLVHFRRIVASSFRFVELVNDRTLVGNYYRATMGLPWLGR